MENSSLLSRKPGKVREFQNWFSVAEPWNMFKIT